MKDDIDENTLDTNEFSTVLVSFALDSCNALTECLRYILENNISHVVDIGIFARDIVDIFIQEINDMEINDLDFELNIQNNELQKRNYFTGNIFETIKRKKSYRYWRLGRPWTPLINEFTKLKQVASNEEKNFKELHIHIMNIKGWLRGIHHHCNKEHMQDYLNEYHFRYNRRPNKRTIFDVLMKKMVDFEKTSIKSIDSKGGLNAYTKKVTLKRDSF